jgi:hypothetical protein
MIGFYDCGDFLRLTIDGRKPKSVAKFGVSGLVDFESLDGSSDPVGFGLLLRRRFVQKRADVTLEGYIWDFE